MLSIHRELRLLAEALSSAEIPFALCGALALAAHGYPRATMDIDILALGGSAAAILKQAEELGYTLKAGPMLFRNGTVRIDRCAKPDSEAETEDFLSLDLLTVDAEIEKSIEIEWRDWEGFELPIVTKASLATLKKLRNSPQDRADLENLEL